MPLWTTAIALAVDGCPVLGIVDAPMIRRRYAACRGRGARVNDDPISVSAVDELGDAFVLHSSMEEWIGGGVLDRLVRVAERSRRTRGLSDSWGHMLVAEGLAEALVEHEPCGEWDWAASVVIVEEAGGRITTLDGSPPRHGSDLLV